MRPASSATPLSRGSSASRGATTTRSSCSRREASDDLVVSTPFLSVAEPRQFLIPIARRLTTEHGEFDGLIVASFIPAAPRRFFRTVDVGKSGVVWVFHPDGVVLYASRRRPIRSAKPPTDNPIFAAAKSGSRIRNAASGRCTPAARQLISAFHSTTPPPLIVAVSLDRNEVLDRVAPPGRARRRCSSSDSPCSLAGDAGRPVPPDGRQADRGAGADRGAQLRGRSGCAKSTSGSPRRSRASGAPGARPKRRAR